MYRSPKEKSLPLRRAVDEFPEEIDALSASPEMIILDNG
jgi:hypothetical protein